MINNSHNIYFSKVFEARSVNVPLILMKFLKLTTNCRLILEIWPFLNSNKFLLKKDFSFFLSDKPLFL